MRDMRSKLNKYYADDFIRKAVQYFDSLSPDAQKEFLFFDYLNIWNVIASKPLHF